MRNLSAIASNESDRRRGEHQALQSFVGVMQPDMKRCMENNGGSGRSSSSSNSPTSFYYAAGDRGGSSSSASCLHFPLLSRFSTSSSSSTAASFVGPDDLIDEIDAASLRRMSASRLPHPIGKSYLSAKSRLLLSPLSPIENRLVVTPPSRSPPVYKMPAVEVDGEEVLVMDGILVDGPRIRGSSSSTRSWSGSTDSTASSALVSGHHHGLYKTEICRAWEELGTCRYGPKCQFAHGKEELRPFRPSKLKTEVGRASAGLRLVSQMPPRSPKLALPAVLSNLSLVDTPERLRAEESVKSRSTAELKLEEMSPEEIALCTDPSLVDQLETHLPRRRQRLPVFQEICPGEYRSWIA